MKKLIYIITSLCFCINSYANDNISLKKDAPKTYVVKKGDSLWSISKLYLEKPWQWPLLWGFNKKQIKNPHFIYPNQVLVLNKNHPLLYIQNTSLNNINHNIKKIKLSPKSYDKKNEYNIPSIPLSLIQSFIEYPKILSQDEIINSPKIIDNPEKNLLSAGDMAYAINIKKPGNYLVYRENKLISLPNNKEPIGTEVEIIGEVATIEAINKDEKKQNYTKKFIFNVPTIKAIPLIILKSRTEIKSNDKLYKLPDDNSYERFNFMPHETNNKIKANILYVYKDSSKLEYPTKFSNIIITCGTKDKIDKGTIISIYKKHHLTKMVTKENTAINPIKNSFQKIKYISYPSNEIAKAMVYHTENDISYAIIIESYQPAQVGDIVSNPGMDLEYLSNNN